MTALRRDVLAALQAVGISRREYVEHYFGPGPDGRAVWGGDVCGCFDDRCANGFHHDGVDDCQCFTVCLDEVLAAKRTGGTR